MPDNFSTYSDRRLIELFQAEKAQREAVFTEFYNRYSSRIYLYCKKILGDTSSAGEVYQDAFLRFLHYLEKGTYIENVMGYLLKTARNLCFNYQRNKKLETVSLDEIHYQIKDVSVESEEMAEVITSALELLPIEHKEAFIYQVYEGLSYKEIGELTNVPLTTVRNRVVRAKRKLREILLPYLDYNR